MEALEQKRQAENLSKDALAKRLGVSDSYLILLRRGERQPGVKILKAIAAEFPDLQLLIFEYIANNGKEEQS